MLLTTDELLLHITLDFRNAEALQMSRQRLVSLREKLRYNMLSEQSKKNLIVRFLEFQNSRSHYHTLRCVRESYTFPAIVRDKHGRFFTETALFLMMEDQHKYDDMNIHRICGQIRHGSFPGRDKLREALNRKGWTMFREREVLPALWDYE